MLKNYGSLPLTYVDEDGIEQLVLPISDLNYSNDDQCELSSSSSDDSDDKTPVPAKSSSKVLAYKSKGIGRVKSNKNCHEDTPIIHLAEKSKGKSKDPKAITTVQPVSMNSRVLEAAAPPKYIVKIDDDEVTLSMGKSFTAWKHIVDRLSACNDDNTTY